MVRARYPDGGVLPHVVAYGREPAEVERIHLLGCSGLIPVALIHAHHLAALTADATAREEIGRVSKHHVEAEPELRERLHTVTLYQGEVVIGGFIV